MEWYITSMDDPIRGPYPSLREVERVLGKKVRKKVGPECYEVLRGYRGDTRRSTVWICTRQAAIADGWTLPENL